jgi:hypothetical protein
MNAHKNARLNLGRRPEMIHDVTNEDCRRELRRLSKGRTGVRANGGAFRSKDFPRPATG